VFRHEHSYQNTYAKCLGMNIQIEILIQSGYISIFILEHSCKVVRYEHSHRNTVVEGVCRDPEKVE
jgi:hypothetical protein